MPARATILIPTFCNSHTLPFSVDSALKQTIEDIEVMIVGDGVPNETREFISHLDDPRVRFFDFPKGERHGELYRHEVLQQANGDIVCYLSDDDLYLPRHVESMLDALEEADFASSLTVWVHPDQQLQVQALDLTRDDNIRLIRYAQNLISLSFAAHTMSLYRRLPYGWRTTPQSHATDHYMWQQVLSESDVKSTNTFRPTSIHFPSPLRKEWSKEKRLAEISSWREKILRPSFAADFEKEVFTGLAKTAASDYARLYLEVFGRVKM